ncbi:MAG: histidine kinase [Actinobacteria bacterium]|nr:histidine kinase [Actinomycetota bacterium]
MEDLPTASAYRLSTTVVMSIAATCAALIAIFGDKTSFSWTTVAFAFAGLVPWAVESGGVRIPPVAFYAISMASAAGIVLVDRNPGGMFPAMIAVVWLTRCARTTLMIALPAITAAGLAVGIALLEGTTHETGAIYFTGGAGVAFLAGLMIRRQEQLVEELRAARVRETEHAAADERTRIAREVHDVVAHSLTVTMLHVTGARRALHHDPDRAAEALERAETVGRESLDSIRQVVGLLRCTEDATGGGDTSHDGHAHAAPLPQLSDIPALVDQYRDAGMRVSAELDLDDVAADGTTSLTAFRVVQEALSNVLQHSPGSPVELRVATDGEGTVLRITAENPTTETPDRPSRRSGLGLRGMRERVRAAGGSVDAGLTEHQTWRIDAALPLRRGRFS